MILLVLWILSVCPARAQTLIFFSGQTDNVPVQPTSTGLTAAVNCFASRCNTPDIDMNLFTELVENPMAYMAPETGIVFQFSATLLVSATLPPFGDPTSPGPITMTFQFRQATETSGFQNTAIAPEITLPSGTYFNQRLSFHGNPTPQVLLNATDRLVLQVRLVCPAGCPNTVLVSFSLAATLVFEPLMPQIGCPTNTFCVSQTLGSDQFGRLSGMPFKTIGAALSAASALGGMSVVLFPGTYQETLTIPVNVSVSGIGKGVIILQQNPSSSVDLVRMSSNSSLERVDLRIITNQHVPLLRAVLLDGTSAESARLQMIDILIDTSAAGDGGTTDVIGIHATGRGWDGLTVLGDAHASVVSILIRGSAHGRKRGILLELSPGIFVVGVGRITVSNTSAIINGATFYGAETNRSLSMLQGRFLALTGTTADISQTLGSITLGTTILTRSLANGFGFSTAQPRMQYIWGLAGAITAGTNFMFPSGTGITVGETFRRITTTQVWLTLSIRMTTGPSAGNSCTWTVRKNQVDTTLTLTATAGVTSVTLNTVSVSAVPGDLLSLEVVCTGLILIAPTDIVVTLDYM